MFKINYSLSMSSERKKSLKKVLGFGLKILWGL